MTNYYINEAILSFSGNISQDSTLNMIRLSDPDAALIISRGKMQDGDELASQVEQQMKKLEKQVKELRYTPAQVVRLGIDGKMEGLEIQSQFIRGNEHVYQYQAVFVLQSSRVMMALTYARSTALTEADRGRWADIKKNLRFRLDPENTAIWSVVSQKQKTAASVVTWQQIKRMLRLFLMRTTVSYLCFLTGTGCRMKNDVINAG